MIQGRWLMQAGGINLNQWTNTNVPIRAVSTDPTYLSQVFFNEHGRWPGNNENVSFTFLIGTHKGRVVSANATSPVGPTYFLGGGWVNEPRQMKLIVFGTLYGMGGCALWGGNVNNQDRWNNYEADGGSLFGLVNTESFINISTPLLVEGNGNMIPGGGGGGGYSITAANTQIRGGNGVGRPSWTTTGPSARFIQDVYRSVPEEGTRHYFGGSTGVYVTGGYSGLSGRAGNVPINTLDENNIPSTAYDNYGERGVVFELGPNGASRFPNSGTVDSFIDLTNYTGNVSNYNKSYWNGGGFARRQELGFYGYLPTSNNLRHRKFLFGVRLDNKSSNDD